MIPHRKNLKQRETWGRHLALAWAVTWAAEGYTQGQSIRHVRINELVLSYVESTCTVTW
jgi:hypothetical protein